MKTRRDSSERTLTKIEHVQIGQCQIVAPKFAILCGITCNVIHQACKLEAAKMFDWKKGHDSIVLGRLLFFWKRSEDFRAQKMRIFLCLAFHGRKYLTKMNANLSMEDLGRRLAVQIRYFSSTVHVT